MEQNVGESRPYQFEVAGSRVTECILVLVETFPRVKNDELQTRERELETFDESRGA